MQLVVGFALIATAIWLWPRRRWRRPHRLYWPARLLVTLALVLTMLLGLVAVLDATGLVRVHVCIELVEGREWCNDDSGE